MNEQDLRDALRDHTSRVDPAPPPWDALVRRATAARRRSLVARAGAVGTAALVAVGLVVATRSEEGPSRLRAAEDPTTSTTADGLATDTTTTSVTAAPTTTVAPTTSAAPMPDWGDCCIWPIAGADDLSAYEQGGSGAHQDAVTVARSFATTYLGMRNPLVGPYEGRAGQGIVKVWPRREGGLDETPAEAEAAGRVHTIVSLRQVGESRAWTVTGAAAPTIVVDRPNPAGTVVASPLEVSGRARAYEGTVIVEVRADGMTAGEALGSGFVTGRGDELGPFEGLIPFRRASTPAGAVLFVEPSAVDGRPLAATVVKVRFSPR